jgi:hypothetical protein
MPAARLALCTALTVLSAPSLAAAQGQASPQPPRREDATPLSGITVTSDALAGLVVNGRRRCILEIPAGERRAEPRVVSTYPAQGAVVPPGKLYVRVTYSQRMSPCGFLLADAAFNPQPEFADEPALLTRDYKSFYFAVTTEPGQGYGMRFNTFTAHNFRSLYGQTAPAYSLTFKTSNAPAARSMSEAMAGDAESADIARSPESLLVLWVPREDGEGPNCGSCDTTESSLKLGPPLKPAG